MHDVHHSLSVCVPEFRYVRVSELLDAKEGTAGHSPIVKHLCIQMKCYIQTDYSVKTCASHRISSAIPMATFSC